MLKPSWRRVLGVLGLAVLLLLTISLESGAKGQVCEHNPQTNQENCSSYSLPLFAAIQVSEFFDAHNGAFTALFTIILALSTIALWTSTKEAADAARDAAEALPALERAYLFIEPEIAFSTRSLKNDIPNIARFENRAWVQYQFVNHGKTPAIIVSLQVNFDLLSDAPDNCEHRPNLLLTSEMVVKSSEYTDARTIELGRLLTNSESDALKAGHVSFWFYGSVIYLDIMGKSHTTRFRWRRGRTEIPFAADGQAPHNERT